MNLKESANLANKILENDTPYKKDKEIIKSYFNVPNGKLNVEIIVRQLTVIDYFYSTNMIKRYYGIEEIAEAILNISDSKEIIAEKFLSHFSEPREEEVHRIFNKKYGYTKKGKQDKRAYSIISKWGYFLTNYSFPIYDSIVKDMVPKLWYTLYQERIREDINSDFPEFLKCFAKVNFGSGIKDVNKLDNLLWLMGKIRKGSYSLILAKPQFLNLVKGIEFKQGKSDKVDSQIKEHIQKNLGNLGTIFTEDQIKMIDFNLKFK